MPFARGPVPLRRTLYYLNQGKIVLRNDVAVLNIGYHLHPTPEQLGASEFVFWHFAQIQYRNPHLQAIRRPNVSIVPFAQAFLNDGREVLFDLENKTKEEIVDAIQQTLGKTSLVKRREFLERMQDRNPADFGSDCTRQCMCEIQGQHPCTCLMIAPKQLKGTWRWNHKLV